MGVVVVVVVVFSCNPESRLQPSCAESHTGTVTRLH